MTSTRRQAILVTGGTGFVGSRFLEVASRRHELFAIARRPPAEPRPGVSWLTVDLDRPLDLERLPDRLDAVVHLAVSPRHREFPESALEQFRVNLASTAALLDHARRAGAESFVLVSSGSVYDATSGAPLREGDALAPSAYFAATKAAAELLLTPYAGLMATCSLRLFFPYGPGQTGRLIPGLVDRVRQGRPVELRGDRGGMRICPTYVDDVVEVLQAAVRARWRGVVNLGGPEVLSLREIARVIGGVVGVDPLFEHHEGPLLRFEPDLGRLRAAIDVSSFRTFPEGLRATLAAR